MTRRPFSTATAIVSPDPVVHRQLQEALESSAIAETVWSLSAYPEFAALERLKEASSGCILFLDYSDLARAHRIAVELDRAYPLVSVVAVLNGGTKDDVIALMRSGVREIIGNPTSASDVSAAFLRAAKKLPPPAPAGGDLYAFLPARAGAGATTIAISTAAAVARLSKQQALLLDFDFRFGISSFLLKLDGRRSVQNALDASSQLDEDFWSRLATRRGALDILGSSPDELPPETSTAQCAALLDSAQACYWATFLDLPGGMEPYELEALNQAKEIFLVLTSDIEGLHMAKRKAEALRRLQLADKVSALISQSSGRATLPMADIEKLLQFPVRFILPKDERAVSEAAMHGVAVRADTKFGAQIEKIAKTIGTPDAKPLLAQRAHRFPEVFSINPDRDRRLWKD